MGWKEQLRKASFKGIKFFVDDHEAEVGRRLVVHEYPFKDQPFVEDMGRSARRFQVTAYVVGDDYMDARDALMDSVESGGVGQLVHPYLGTKSVVAESARVRETKAEGRYALVALVFVESGLQQFPSGAAVPADLVGLRADALISAARGIFTGGMTVDNVLEFVRDSYAGDLSAAADIFNSIRLNGGINNQGTLSLINQAASWVADIADLSSPSLTLIQDLSGAADRLINGFKGLFDLGGSSKSAAKNLSLFEDFASDRSLGSSGQAEILNDNAVVSERFIRSVALAVETKAFVSQDFESYDQAISERASVLRKIDTLSGDSVNDEEYDALRSLRNEVARAVPSEVTSLPRLGTLDLPQSMPSLAVAYDLYESVSRETDIINRNKIRHPGFIGGGQTLQILKDAEN